MLVAKTLVNLMVVIGAKATGLEKTLSKTEKNLNKFGRTATAAGATLTKAITLPLVAVGGAALKTFADFEKAMTESTAIMGDLSDEMRTKLEKAAREVAKTTRFSATEAAQSYYYLASAGLDAAQSIEALPKVAAFAQAGNFDMALATDLLTDAQSALGMTIRDDVVKNMENMTRVSDALTKAQVLANATTQQFSESLTNKAGMALRDLNKDVEEGLAVLAVYADQGKKGAEAGESLYIVLRDLQRALINNRDAFKKYGVEVFDSFGNVKNMADIIGDLEGALGGLSHEHRRMALMEMGFQDRSVANIQALLGTSDAIRRYEKELRNAAGTTEEVAAKQLNNLWDQLGLVKSRALDAGITLGEALGDTVKRSVIPAVDGLIGKLETSAEKFGALTTAEQQSIIKKFALAAAIPVVILGLGKLSFAVTNIINLFKTLGGAKLIAAIVTGLQGLTTATLLAAAPWVALAAAIGAVILAAPKLNELMTGGVNFNPETGMYDNKAWGLPAPKANTMGGLRMIDEQVKTFSGLSSIKQYGGGGVVPGPIGSPQPAIVHGGEEILTPEQRGKGGININIYGPISSEKDADYYGNMIVRKLIAAGVTV